MIDETTIPTATAAAAGNPGAIPSGNDIIGDSSSNCTTSMEFHDTETASTSSSVSASALAATTGEASSSPSTHKIHFTLASMNHHKKRKGNLIGDGGPHYNNVDHHPNQQQQQQTPNQEQQIQLLQRTEKSMQPQMKKKKTSFNVFDFEEEEEDRKHKNHKSLFLEDDFPTFQKEVEEEPKKDHCNNYDNNDANTTTLKIDTHNDNNNINITTTASTTSPTKFLQQQQQQQQQQSLAHEKVNNNDDSNNIYRNNDVADTSSSSTQNVNVASSSYLYSSSLSISYSDSSSIGSCEDEYNIASPQMARSPDNNNNNNNNQMLSSSSSSNNCENEGKGKAQANFEKEVSGGFGQTQSQQQRHQQNHEQQQDHHNFNQHNNYNQHNNRQQQQQQQQLIPQPSATSGWRVKLYRLNVDGSWYDCGTGRICLIRKNIGGSAPHFDILATENVNSNISIQFQDLNVQQQYQKMEEDIYHSVGDPTLFVHNEITVADDGRNSGTETQSHMNAKSRSNVLLRTRVLLRDSYQRQGENIITWCEPYYGMSQKGSLMKNQPSHQHTKNTGGISSNLESENQEQEITGVDLALSFQDNAGCLDIWKKISNIQLKAFELFQSRRNSALLGNGHTQSDSSPGASNTFISNDQEQEKSKQTESESKYDDTRHTSELQSLANKSIQEQHIHRIQHNHNGISPTPDGERQIDQKKTLALHEIDNSNTSKVAGNMQYGNSDMGVIKFDDDENEHNQHNFIEAEAAAVSMAAQYVGSGHLNNGNDSLDYQEKSQQILQQLVDIESGEGNMNINAQLPNLPNLGNLEEIADTIAAAQPNQREAISLFISLSNCAYLKSLLALFPDAEKKDDYNILATLASIIKSILLFNETGIIQLIASDGNIFEDCCCCLEYDPDLRSKANHRWFIRNRLKFRTVVYMEDQELVETVHRSFRVTYIRDTLLRPTMDESSLTTLGSLLTFTQADVVKGVIYAPDRPHNNSTKSSDSYLEQVLGLLGKEIMAIREVEWSCIYDTTHESLAPSSDNSAVHFMSQNEGSDSQDSSWQQHLIAQDNSLSSRKLRRRGCLSFLRELFNMVRNSLQQSDKENFYNLLVGLDVELNINATDTNDEIQTVTLLSLLGAILSDVNSDISEKGACLEILSIIAMFDASLIRKHCLVEFSSAEKDVDISKDGDRNMAFTTRPHPDDDDKVIFVGRPNDLLMSLLFLMTIENDAGIMLQTSEVMRIILDTEMLSEVCQLNGVPMMDNEDEILIGSPNNGPFQYVGSNSNGGGEGGSEQNLFLQNFYDHYVPWFFAPLQYSTLVVRSAIPYSLCNKVISFREQLKTEPKSLFQEIVPSALRLSFAVELLGFCVRAHCFRMKRYLLSSKVLTNVVKLLSPASSGHVAHNDRCLKLSILRCLRSILSLKDEFYNRYLVQNNLFRPIFEAFRANPIGDNLVSSSIIEMCDFITTENIKSVIEHIVTKHLSEQPPSPKVSNAKIKRRTSLEDIATPYVNTLTLLRQKHEENLSLTKSEASENLGESSFFDNENQRMVKNDKAREDQRKFREAGAEESYFFDDMVSSDARPPSPALPSPQGQELTFNP